MGLFRRQRPDPGDQIAALEKRRNDLTSQLVGAQSEASEALAEPRELLVFGSGEVEGVSTATCTL